MIGIGKNVFLPQDKLDPRLGMRAKDGRIRLATMQSRVDASHITVKFDDEDVARTKAYRELNTGYVSAAGDRVVALYMGGSYAILGSLK